MPTNESQRHVVFGLQGQLYATPVTDVRQFVSMRGLELTAVPGGDSSVAGVVLLRGETITTYDMRTLLGLPSLQSEVDALVQLLHEREQDHENWLHELEAALAENREFKLATDPHKCKFGQWYDSLRQDAATMARLTNGDLGVRWLIDSFDEPHKTIHGIAEKAIRLEEAGDLDGAHELIRRTRVGALAALKRLFAQLRAMLSGTRQSVLMIAEMEERVCGLLVDFVQRVVTPDSISPASESVGGNRAVNGFARVTGHDGLISCVDLAKLLPALMHA